MITVDEIIGEWSGCVGGIRDCVAEHKKSLVVVIEQHAIPLVGSEIWCRDTHLRDSRVAGCIAIILAVIHHEGIPV